MPAWLDRVTLKLTVLIVLFAVLMGAATTLIVTRGYSQTEQNATARSAAGLESQGRDALQSLTLREAQVTAAEFTHVASLGQIAARYMVADPALGKQTRGAGPRLRREPTGQYADPSANRVTDIFVPSARTVTSAQLRDLRDSANLDLLFPTLRASGQDTTAIYFIGSTGVGRYYPPTGISGLLQPDYAILRDPSYAAATPGADRLRATIWRAPYVNAQQTGVQVTASVPVYAGNVFRGVIAVDVSLSGLLSHLSTLKPTATGYAFLIDRSGRLVAAPPSDLGDLLSPDLLPPAITPATILGISLTASSTPGFGPVLAAMRAGRQGIADLGLGGRQVFLAYAPLPGLGWSLGLVAPIAEITAQSAAVDAAIKADAASTLWSTLTAILASLTAVLLITLAASRWLLVRPLSTVTAATKAVAAGDLSVRIPVSGRDEIAQLALSFNAMTSVLAEFYEMLELRVKERTHELSTLLDVSRNVASTLELAPLLDLILDQLKSMVDYTSATINIIDADHLVVLEYRGPAPHGLMVGLRMPLDDARPHIDVVYARSPIVLDNVQQDTAVTRAFTRATGIVWAETFGQIRSWLGVPLIVKERAIGMLAVIHSEPSFYKEHHGQLASVIAAQAAVAIENAQLYAQAQEFAAFKERSRLARELHDSVSQALYGIALGARTARSVLDRTPERAAEPLDYVLSLAEAGLAEMRALIFELRPESLETEGLVAALDHQAAAARARHGLDVTTALGTEREVPFGVKEALYRIALEALHNAVKHARARSVNLALDWADEELRLEVSDDGQGFDPGGVYPGHLGLQTMRERAQALGGSVTIRSERGQGTTVAAKIPW